MQNNFNTSGNVNSQVSGVSSSASGILPLPISSSSHNTTNAPAPILYSTSVAAAGSAAGGGLPPNMTSAPPPPPGVYTTFAHGTGACHCPACDLAQRYAVIYSKQFPAMTPHGTEQNRIENATQENRSNVPCQMWEAYRFCFHGKTCLFPHNHNNNNDNNDSTTNSLATNSDNSNAANSNNNNFFNAGVTASLSVDEIAQEITKMCDEHATGNFSCRVCGYKELFDASCIIKVGEMYSYLTCPRCTSPLYQPLTLHLVEAVLRETGGQDHSAYKDKIDSLRASLPHMVRIPLMFEAHRLASTYFAWTLVSPQDAACALRAAIEETPLRDAAGVVSMGSGTGYAEHVFAEAHKMLIADEKTCPLSPEYRKSFSVLAFDEILRESRFSVPVQFGTPDMINCLTDVKKTILLLSWPPFGSPGGPQATMGYDVLKRFVELGGQVVIYIGDVASTGDYDFHLLLQQAFRPVRTYRTRHELRRWVPQEMGLVYAGNDTIGVYKRRESESGDDDFMYFAH